MSDQEAPNYPNVKQSWIILGIITILIVVATPVLQLEKIAGEELALLVYYLIVMGSSFLLVHLLRKRKTGSSDYNFGLGSVRIMLLISLTTVVLQIGILQPIVYLLPMPEFIKEVFFELNQYKGVYAIINSVVAAPVLEELIFRGIILDGLLRKYSAVQSILLSSFFFGIIHFNPWQFITAMVLGVFIGWVYYRTGKLTLCILIHMFNNLFGFIILYFVDIEAMLNNSLSEIYGGIAPFLVITGGAIGITVICIRLLKKHFSSIKLVQWRKPIPATAYGEDAVNGHSNDESQNY